ncbi:hypothetical protein [Breoghania sp. JC706]|uniref:hypothetical protein n=1 Tax=Breoghania sp. JC706 TaxID=3117732 RepID=UPI00300846BC
MADYHAVLKRAIDALPENTGAARRAVYQRARQAIVNQLKSYDPPLAPSAITTEQLHLEEAIRKVEADAARASLGLGPAPRPAAAAPQPSAPAQPSSPAPAQTSAPASAPASAPSPASAPAPNGAPAATPTRPEAEPVPGYEGGRGAERQAEEKPAAAPVAPPVVPGAAERPVGNGGKTAATKPPAGESASERAGGHAGGRERIEPTPPAADDIFDDEPETGPKPARNGNGGAAEAPEQGTEPRGNGKSGNGGPQNGGPENGRRGRDAISDLDAMTRGAQDPTASTMPRYSDRDLRPSRLPMIGAAVVAIVVFIGLVSVVYTQRDSILAMFSGSDTPQASDTASGTDEPASSEGGKDTARLLNDDGSPAAPDARAVTTTRVVPPAEDGVTVAPQGGEPETSVDEPDATQAGEPDNSAAATAPAAANSDTQAPASASQATPVAQRAILYEESADASSGGSAEQGRVLWSTAQETPAGGSKSDTVIKAQITIPGRDVAVELTIRPNQDKTLPASHLIELKFNLPKDFAGKGISSVPGLIMKTTEEARGDALRGASVRVADGFFWVALSSIPDERERNIALLRDRGWIDIPILYETGKRAILTLEKGSPGDRVVQTALDAWTKS